MSDLISHIKSLVTRLIVLTTAIVFTTVSVASGISLEQTRLFDSGIYDFDADIAASCRAETQGPAVSGSVYMLGDSITVGSEQALQNAIAANGLAFSKINAVTGRAISAPGEGSETGLQAIDNDASTIASSGAVVIALGTNASGADEAGVTEMINKIESPNIFWVNIFSPGAPNRESFNQLLTELSSTLSFTVIDVNSAGVAVSSDNLHPTAPGQTSFAQAVANALSGGQTESVSASGCVCSAVPSGSLDRDARYREVWGYFTTGKGLSEEATAGLMGNLEAESGIDPQNTQNNAPAPDGPEIPIEAIRNRYGYGIAQWTSAGRQQNLINYAQETGRSTGDLGLQLDFLWKELNESYAGVLTTLQTPSVSLAEASDEVILRFEIPESVLLPPRSTAERKQASLEARRALGGKIFAEFSGQSIPSVAGSGCNGQGVEIDLESEDTTNIPCGGNTQDQGASDGYMGGKLYKIRLCTVGGTQANSQIAASLEQLLTDSSTAGIEITFGSFRSMERQIEMYTDRCSDQGLTPTPPPYPKASHRDYQSCDSIAPPGYSNHQMGFAIDVSCSGSLIPRYHPEAESNECFKWLEANAVKYGLYEFGKGEGNRTSGSYEAWHWSVDGN